MSNLASNLKYRNVAKLSKVYLQRTARYRARHGPPFSVRAGVPPWYRAQLTQ